MLLGMEGDPKDTPSGTSEGDDKPTTDSEEAPAEGDDSAESGDDETTEAGGDDEGTEDSTSDGEGNLFFDPNQIPKELQPAWKKMQGSFTKKMQGLAVVARKAEAFDRLAADPRFNQWLKEMQGDAPRKPSNGDPSSKAKPDEDAARAMIREEVEAALRPVTVQQAKDQAKQQFEAFKVAHPEWENYQVAMAELMEENPSLSYPQAFKLASYEDAKKAGGKDMLERMKTKKKANVSKPSGNGVTSPTPKRAKTIKEAYERAKADLLRKK